MGHAPPLLRPREVVLVVDAEVSTLLLDTYMPGECRSNMVCHHLLRRWWPRPSGTLGTGVRSGPLLSLGIRATLILLLCPSQQHDLISNAAVQSVAGMASVNSRWQFQNGAPTYCGPRRKTAVIANAAIAAAIKMKSKRSNSINAPTMLYA